MAEEMVLVKWRNHGAVFVHGDALPRAPGDEDLLPAGVAAKLVAAGRCKVVGGIASVPVIGDVDADDALQPDAHE